MPRCDGNQSHLRRYTPPLMRQNVYRPARSPLRPRVRCGNRRMGRARELVQFLHLVFRPSVDGVDTASAR